MARCAVCREAIEIAATTSDISLHFRCESLTEPHAEPLEVEPGGASPDQSLMGSCTGGVESPEAGEAATTASRPSEGQATS